MGMRTQTFKAVYTGHTSRRRGAVAVQVAVSMGVIVGFAALTIDVGVMYNAKTDLQRNADAAALAAASKLASFDEGDPITLARAEANKYAGFNKVLRASVQLGSSDIEFGRAMYNSTTGGYDFVPTTTFPDAVRVVMKKTAGSANGALPLYFARIFGKQSTDITAEAIAMMVPRDIAIVADLSASHNDDSELRNYNKTDINLFEVWDALQQSRGTWGIGNGVSVYQPGDVGNPPPAPGLFPGGPGNSGNDPGSSVGGGQVGPTFGLMYYWGNTITQDFEPNADPGLRTYKKNQNWNNADLETWYADAGYNNAEIDAMMSKDYDGNGAWEERVAVALGLARWDSGMDGGLWESIPEGQRQEGNGNGWVGGSELTWLVDYPFEQGSWIDYISFGSKTWSRAYKANSDFRYQYGLKTFVNYLLERRSSNAATSDLATVPAQPMQAVKEAVTFMANMIEDLDTDDRLSLEIYGETARHEIDLTDDYASVASRLNEMQAGYYDGWTNMGGGITRAIEELTSSRARPTARKVMILLTDGRANVTADGSAGDYTNGPLYAKEMAQVASAQGIRIFAVSVGSGSDVPFMEDIAEIGFGESFQAAGSIDAYSAQLEAIFKKLGGTRPVELIK
ncbi:MAG: VWA domain-containing protein [Planctomycetes bacterium]|nr:VWA domain-containing protein [Planctomycetota bacterium]